jgi:hypothetical protein
MFRSVRWLAAFGIVAWLAAGEARAGAETEVDLALVLAVDVSRSMDTDEQDLQRDGFVRAFRAAAVHEAIRQGMLGRIAVTYMEWSGEHDQKVIVPWTVLDSSGTATAFSDRLASQPIGRIFQTSISAAIDYASALFDTSGVEPLRKVIDISGDGPNSSGRSVVQARDEAVAKGITINGLPIMLKRPSGMGDMENLDAYYRDCVIGGGGAFIVPVRDREQFADAIKTKIIREIVSLEPRVQFAQGEMRMNCFTRGGGFYRNQGP